MKRFVFVTAVLFLTTAVVAERNPYYDNWLTPERLARWQNLSQNMDYVDLFTLIEEMYYLERRPWGEPEKQILLKMTETRMRLAQDRLAGRPVIVPDHVLKVDEPIEALLDEMVSWQDDPRFIEFQVTFIGGGLAARGLARIGESAFDAVVAAFDKKLIRSGAPWAIRLMMEKENGFLRNDPVKYAMAKRALIKATRSTIGTTQLYAIDALRYFPDPEVFTLLETISTDDSWPRQDPIFDLRARAQEALKYMRARGGGF